MTDTPIPTPPASWGSAPAAEPTSASDAPSAPAPTSPDAAPAPAAPAASSLEQGAMVTYTYTDETIGADITIHGLVVEVIAPYTDESDGSQAPERVRVAWLNAVSGPIEATDLEKV